MMRRLLSTVFPASGPGTRLQRSTTEQSRSDNKKHRSRNKHLLKNKFYDEAAAMQAKLPHTQDLTAMLKHIVYEKPFSEVNKDILRLIRRVSVVTKTNDGEADSVLDLTNSAALVPSPSNDHNFSLTEELSSEKQGVFLVMLLLRALVSFFETSSFAEEATETMNGLFLQWIANQNQLKDTEKEPEDNEELEMEDVFTVLKLVEAIGGVETKAARALKCVHQNVAISGHMLVKTKICPFFTKDVSGADGWKITMVLSKNDFVQVKHAKKETSITLPPNMHNQWELQYSVFMTFDPEMNDLTATKLEVTGLKTGASIDADLKTYLEDKFNNGSLIVQ